MNRKRTGRRPQMRCLSDFLFDQAPGPQEAARIVSINTLEK